MSQESFITAVKKRRELAEISQAQAAEMIGVSTRSIINYIKAKEIEIYRINREINGEKKKLKGLELQERRIHDAIGSLIRQKNELDSFSFIEAIFSKKTISDFFIDWNNFDVIKVRLASASEQLQEIKQETEEKTNELAEFESRERDLKSQKETEAQAEAKRRAEQNSPHAGGR